MQSKQKHAEPCPIKRFCVILKEGATNIKFLVVNFWPLVSLRKSKTAMQRISEHPQCFQAYQKAHVENSHKKNIHMELCMFPFLVYCICVYEAITEIAPLLCRVAVKPH